MGNNNGLPLTVSFPHVYVARRVLVVLTTTTTTTTDGSKVRTRALTHRCIAGTSDGRVVVFKNGVLLTAYRPNEVDEIDVTAKTEYERLSYIELSADPVRSLVVNDWGLAVLAGVSTVYYFRKTEEGRRYPKPGGCTIFATKGLKTNVINGLQ